ncbi:MAG: GNAT family N-acetyltransferase [Firmicutes bacterium]|nr:GNAT family N-acetyltransferase [Bacillota bacterium]
MRIAILSPWTIKPTSVGGTERFVIDIAESLTKSGNVVDVYMLSGETYNKNNVNYISIDLFDNKNNVDEYFLREYFNNFDAKSSFDALSKKIAEKINIDKYDLIQLNSQLFLTFASNKKRIFTIHTNPFEYELDWGRESFKTMLEVMRSENENEHTYFVTPSYYYKDIYSKLINSEIGCIPHAIDIERLSCKKDKKDILKNLGLEQDKKVILLPSRLEPIQKQPMLFMKAFAKLDNKIKSKYQVVCSGADEQYKKFATEITSFCKDNNIDVNIKRFDSMSDAYKIADVVILPSKSESFGYAALESLSLGIVTILNNIPTYMEIAKYAENYYVFDNSVDGLVNVLKNILGTELDRKEQNRMWSSKYSIDLFGNKYLNYSDRKNENVNFYLLSDKLEYIDEYLYLCAKEWPGDKTSDDFIKKINIHKKNILEKNDPLIDALIMTVRGEMIGFISLFREDGKEYEQLTPWVATYYIKEQYRNNGLGQLLFKKMLEYSAKMGYSKVYFKSYKENYYERHFDAKYMTTLNDGEKLYHLSLKK